ncbi:unnamed protein product, partial [Discosporangium mesarthrocarpum]
MSFVEHKLIFGLETEGCLIPAEHRRWKAFSPLGKMWPAPAIKDGCLCFLYPTFCCCHSHCGLCFELRPDRHASVFVPAGGKSIKGVRVGGVKLCNVVVLHINLPRSFHFFFCSGILLLEVPYSFSHFPEYLTW